MALAAKLQLSLFMLFALFLDHLETLLDTRTYSLAHETASAVHTRDFALFVRAKRWRALHGLRRRQRLGRRRQC